MLTGQVPGVDDRRVDEAGERRRFRSRILPPYMRRSPKVAEVLPILHLRGLSTGDFRAALPVSLSEEADGLAPTTIARLTAQWEAEYTAFRQRDLSGRGYVYIWVDGVHFTIRLEDERLRTLVVIRGRADGTKEVIAVEDGHHESTESWLTLLRDLKRRGMTAPAVAVGDGALGFWKAGGEMWPETVAPVRRLARSKGFLFGLNLLMRVRHHHRVRSQGRVEKHVMDSLPAESSRAEELRIQAAYARRQDEARYSWFNPGHLFSVQDRERRVLGLLRELGFAALETKEIFEIGCGTGFWLRDFIKWGAQPTNLSGVDLLPDRMAKARALCPEGVKIQCGSAAKLAYPDETFDIVLQSTVFTSVLNDDIKRQMAAEMIRVVKGKGLILWYDYHVNNPWNPDVQGVKKAEIHRLFHGCQIDLRRITLAPPLVRFLAPYSWLVCHLLTAIPLLCTHYLGVIRKQ
jgi:SAM-dependent methyltransferase